MRLAGLEERMGDRRGVYRVLVGNPEGKRTRRRWKDNIKMELQELGLGGMDWTEMVQDRDRWRTLVNAVMNFRVPKTRGISLLAANRLASQGGLCSME